MLKSFERVDHGSQSGSLSVFSSSIGSTTAFVAPAQRMPFCGRTAASSVCFFASMSPQTPSNPACAEPDEMEDRRRANRAAQRPYLETLCNDNNGDVRREPEEGGSLEDDRRASRTVAQTGR
jgi:hypothetical protein